MIYIKVKPCERAGKMMGFRNWVMARPAKHNRLLSSLHRNKTCLHSPFLCFPCPFSPLLLILSPLNQQQSPTFFFPRLTLQVLCRSSPRPTQQQVLQFVADPNENTIPCVRTFENDLARLSLVGTVRFDQALTAAAADGGRAASKHLDSGVPAMVVEAIFPGPADERATVSTRLFLPAKKVKEKAEKLKSSFKEDVLSATTSQNILAMTFRQVVLQQLWNFELVLFRPGTERNIEALENPREVPASFFLGSWDEQVISALAEAVCIAALQNTERHFINGLLGKSSGGFLGSFWRPQKITSRDSSVVICKLLEDQIVENVKSLLGNFNSIKESFAGMKVEHKYKWWAPEAQSELDKIGGPEFSAWISEYVPAYKLQIHAVKFKDAKFERWRKTSENWREVLLTHSQMVGLAEIFDMYYEDLYTLPNKELSCDVANFTNFSNEKRSSSLMNILSVTLASGIFLVSISALSQFGLSHFCKVQMHAQGSRSLTSSAFEYAVNESLDVAKQDFCILICKKMKDYFGWPGDITTDAKVGAWIGEIPDYFRMAADADFASEENSTDSHSIQKLDADLKSSAQDIASYQVVLTTEGKIVGFQPTSRVGVNHWAANPLAKELYGGRPITPGFVEPGLKIHFPNDVILIELLISVDSDVYFVLARPVR